MIYIAYVKMAEVVALLVFGVAGYNFGNFIGGASEGEKGRLHWDWWIRKTKFHMHHWMIMLMLLVLYLLFIKPNALDMPIVGFLLGGIIQGLSYDDWNKFIVE